MEMVARNRKIYKWHPQYKLIQTLYLSIKKRGLFSEFVTKYVPNQKLLSISENLPLRTKKRLRSFDIKIGDISVSYKTNNDIFNMYHDIMDRTLMVNTFLVDSNTKVAPNHIKPNELTKNFLLDEIERNGEKFYMNDMKFRIIFGTMASIVGLILTNVLICTFFSSVFTIFYINFVILLLILSLILIPNKK